MPGSEQSRFHEFREARVDQKHLAQQAKEGFKRIGEALKLEAKYQLVVDAVKEGVLSNEDMNSLQSTLVSAEKAVEGLKSLPHVQGDRHIEDAASYNLMLAGAVRQLEEIVFKYKLDEDESEGPRLQVAKRLLLRRIKDRARRIPSPATIGCCGGSRTRTQG
ncbi:MAG: hypothetical protein UY95_C0018G0006 [Parcubacteria group bacterium GW2011_GWA2_56_7]|nr:MAG: hypothetical protein UY95_C0018G0006 [Parcubacteria group bacterium GW2011_GWA2_56_7]